MGVLLLGICRPVFYGPATILKNCEFFSFQFSSRNGCSILFLLEIEHSYLENNIGPYDLGNFANSIFPLGSIVTTSNIAAHICTTLLHIPDGFLQSYDYIEKLQVHILSKIEIQFFIKKMDPFKLGQNLQVYILPE